MSDPNRDPIADQPLPLPPAPADLQADGAQAAEARAAGSALEPELPAEQPVVSAEAVTTEPELLPWQVAPRRAAVAEPQPPTAASASPAGEGELFSPRRRVSAALPALPTVAPEPPWRDKARGFSSFFGMLLLVLAIVLPWWWRHHKAGDLPRPETLAKAAEILRTRAVAGDAVAFAPGWSSHQRVLFQQLWLSKGWDPKADFLTTHPLDLWQADGKRRLWVVTTHGWVNKMEAVTKTRGTQRLEQHQLDHATAVELYSLPSSTTVLDVRRELSQATVQIGAPDNWKACPWQAGSRRFACGGLPWQDVYEDLQEVGNTRHDCIYLHPPHDHGAVRLTVRETGAAQLVGRIGNRLWAVRHGPEGTPVRFRVLIGDQVKFERTLPTDDFGWHPFAVPLTPEQSKQPIVFEAFTEKEAWREICLDARLQASPSEPAATAAPRPKGNP